MLVGESRFLLYVENKACGLDPERGTPGAALLALI
jgi:hypothetical protein